jgi:hypothetical protein
VATSRGPGASPGSRRWDNGTRSGTTSKDRVEVLQVGAGAGPEGGEGRDGGETARAELLISHGAEPEETGLRDGSSGGFVIVKGRGHSGPWCGGHGGCEGPSGGSW